MTATCQQTLRSAGAHFMGRQQRCVLAQPVVVSVWHKKTSPGLQN
jgi:hypothetical protein